MPLHHNVYVIALDLSADKIVRQVLADKSRFGAVYVGMTGIPVAERFAQHKRGYKHNSLVRNHGLHLVASLMHDCGPFTFEDAKAREEQLAGALRRRGYTVYTG